MQLTHLSLSENKLSMLPLVLYKLISLQVLDLSQSHLRSLLFQTANLTHL